MRLKVVLPPLEDLRREALPEMNRGAVAGASGRIARRALEPVARRCRGMGGGGCPARGMCREGRRSGWERMERPREGSSRGLFAG